MTQQPEALRLADKIAGYRSPDCGEAAAELRRLHNLCAEWEKKAATWLASPEAAKRLDGYRELAQRLNAAESVNAQLLELMREIGNANAAQVAPVYSELARAALAAAKGEA
jgi:hypothetical protein